MSDGERLAPGQHDNQTFGYEAVDVWDASYNLLHQLSLGRRRDQDGWQKTDARAFDEWAVLELRAESLVVPPSLDIERRREFRQAWQAFHAALPFDEAEGNWLWKNFKRGSPRGVEYAELSSLIANDDSEAEIMSAGIRRVVKARELASRWVPWRAGSGAYEGQESVALARNALSEIVLLTHPSLGLPKSYLARRRAPSQLTQ
jgi:hypothetical protein